MKDLAIALDNRPGALAEMGEALGRAGVSVEGGGAWVADGAGIAHSLFEDGMAAARALEGAGIRVLAQRDGSSSGCSRRCPGSSECSRAAWRKPASTSRSCTAITTTD